MKYFLLLAVTSIISTSCLPRDKDFRQKERSEANDDNPKTDDNKADRDGANRDEANRHEVKTPPEEILSYKYRFSNEVDLAIKIDRKGDGNFSKLQIIDLGNNSAIDSIPLSLVPQAIRISSRANHQNVSLFNGESYLRGGYYHLRYEGDLTKTSITELINNPPTIEFTKFRYNNGQRVVQQGRILQKLTASEWQQLAGQRPNAPSFTNPPPLPDYLQKWFDDKFNIGSKKLEKLEHNRAITIANHTYYGTIYQGWDNKNSCWTQLWGFDDVAVVKFFYDQNLTFLPGGEDGSSAILCKRDIVVFACAPNYIKEQGVLQLVNNNLIVRDANGKIDVHIDSKGHCLAGAPQ